MKRAARGLVILTLAACGEASHADVRGPSAGDTDAIADATSIADAADADGPGAGDLDASADAVAPADSGGGDAGPPGASGYDALFIGNSFIFVNDVAGHYRAIASAFSPAVRVV